MSPFDTREAMRLSGRTQEEIASIMGVSQQTITRWRTVGAPDKVSFALTTLAGFMAWPAWNGWTVDRKGYLQDPRGIIYTRPEDIYRMDWLLRQPIHLQAEFQAWEARQAAADNDNIELFPGIA